MAYTEPKVWSAGDVLTAADMNTYIGDNMAAVHNAPGVSVVLNENADFGTNSTTFVDIDATRLALTIESTGGDLLVGFCGTADAGNRVVHFDLDLDGTRVGGDDGIFSGNTNGTANFSFVRLLTGVSAGSHTIKLMWKSISGVYTKLYAGAGTSGLDLHPQFWVKEMK